ncbi:fungal-specific transcription factor domain-containing protein [Lipomyces doorenjongii]
MASIVQLVFFELFAGQGNVWHIHLRAATNWYHRVCREKLVYLGLTEKSRTMLLEDLPLFEEGPVVREGVVIFRFLAGTIVWLDITSSITAGTAPRLLPYHFHVAAPNSQTKLEDIMGCKNWVMLEIGRIAALHDHKTQALQQARFDYTEFEQTVGDIGREIQCGLTQGALEGFDISDRDSTAVFNTMSEPITLVTRIFAYMASIYLHLVAHGFQQLDVLDTTISEAMGMLRSRLSFQLLPPLVCPLFVIGSVARQGDEQFMRMLFSSPPLLDPLLEHRGRILPILEEIWSRRQSTPGFAWKDSLELTRDLLLL